MGVISDSNADGSINRDHLDTYVHGVHKWKINLYDDDIDYCAPYYGCKYGVENKSTTASWKGSDQPRPPISSIVKPFHANPSSAGEGQTRKRKVKASRVFETVSLIKKSIKGSPHRGADKSVPSGSQVAPPSPNVISLSPTEEVVTLIEDYASGDGDEGRTAVVLSPVCMRKIDFVDEPYVPEAPHLTM